MRHLEGTGDQPVRNPTGPTRRILLGGIVLALVAASCSGSSTDDTSSPELEGDMLDQAFTAPPAPDLDPQLVSRGEDLYRQNCASCHKPDRSGAPNWKSANENGVFPPPPHDNSGHTWHHADDLLVGIVLDGLEGVPSAMPEFRGKLTESDVIAILEFFKSEWGDEERAFQWQVTWQNQQ